MGPHKNAGNPDKPKRKKKAAATAHFSGVKFGNWVYPPLDEGAMDGIFEVKLMYSAAGGRLIYEFPYSNPMYPDSNRAMMDYPLSSVVAVEIDNDLGAMTVLLAAPPSMYLGQQSPALQGQVEAPSPVFDTLQVDFSAGPAKTYRCHTLYLGPSGAGVPGSRGRGSRIKAAALAAWGGRGGSMVPSVAVRKFVLALCQDEMLADIIEQERQAEPGGSFPLPEIEASMRPVVLVDACAKAPKGRRRASAADAMDDDDDIGPPKKKRSYKPRASSGAHGGRGGGGHHYAEDSHLSHGPSAGHVLELGMQHPAFQQPQLFQHM